MEHYITASYMDEVMDWMCQMDTPLTRFINKEFVMEEGRTLHIIEFNDSSAMVNVMSKRGLVVCEYPVCVIDEWYEVMSLVRMVGVCEGNEYVLGDTTGCVPTVMISEGSLLDTLHWYNGRCEDEDGWIQVCVYIITNGKGERVSETLRLRFMFEHTIDEESECADVYDIEPPMQEDLRAFARLAYALGLELNMEDDYMDVIDDGEWDAR